jgi:metal-responsive CopG/Arc/MetJ family transcriptional regulator
MSKQKIAITLERQLLTEVDGLVASGTYSSRSQAIGAAIAESLTRAARTRLIRECGNLDPCEERAIADEGLGTEGIDWPAY